MDLWDCDNLSTMDNGQANTTYNDTQLSPWMDTVESPAQELASTYM